MADVRLAIQVDASGAVRSVKTFNDELGKTPDKARDAGGALGSLRGRGIPSSGFGAGGASGSSTRPSRRCLLPLVCWARIS